VQHVIFPGEFILRKNRRNLFTIKTTLANFNDIDYAPPVEPLEVNVNEATNVNNMQFNPVT